MRIILSTLLAIIIIGIFSYRSYFSNKELPLIAIANYGPHSSLEDSIKGIKIQLTEQGYIENKNIQYDIADVGFDSALIPQMVTNLYTKKPAVMIAMTTPVAQFAKYTVKGIPLIFNVITDPVEAGLLKNSNESDANMTCASDMQNLELLLDFAKKLLPNATRVGVLYSTAEANDFALVKILEKAAEAKEMKVVAVPVDQPRDIPTRMQQFKNYVDFIYVGTSGPIQPALPTITAEADKMHIPVFNANEEAVTKGQVLASYGVDYIQIGRNTGEMVVSLLKGNKISKPIYPAAKDHHGFISKKRAAYFGIEIPKDLANTTIVE